MNGWQTLLKKEVLRFWKVSFQTVAAPVLTAVLYLLIFGHVLEGRVLVYDRISYWAWFGAYVGASVLRGLLVGVGVFIVTLYFAIPEFTAPLWILVFGLLGAALLGTLGLIAGLWADKFDQMAAFQNFLIMPMTFLSGVFYSVHSLPGFWQQVSHLNPFFYMIDGFRYGFFGVSDASPWLSLAIVGGAWLAVSALALHLLRTGYKIRN
jgi:ABC-2 type transport system permease protein